MVLTGRVTRLERYGAFVDIGVERDGLVHVSEIAQGYVKNPTEYVSVGEKVEVRVVSVNLRKGQIELSMKDVPTDAPVETEEEEENPPTAIEVALKEAMAQSEQESEQKSRRKRRKALDAERAEVLARTLRSSKRE
jgi:predicted RNA-binding protein with RPS1 domain